MKKLFIIMSVLVTVTITISGCKKELEEKYNNPEKTSDANIPGFFTAILNNNRVRPAYWNVRTFLLQQPAVYSQTAFFSNSNTAYQQSDGYSQNYWEDFYAPSGNGSGSMALYRAMQVVNNSASTADQTSNELFMQAAKVALIEQAAKMVDMWGDIPYNETGSLLTNNIIKNPKFDDQVQLYTSFIADLDAAATYFSKATTSPAFAKYDILLSGNVDKWRRYANSLRLRLLMRISNVNEATAKTAVLNMLNNSAQYPLIDGGSSYSPATTDVLLKPLTTNIEVLNSALTELPSHYASDYLLNKVMLPSNDPRIPVMFDKYGRTVNIDKKDVFVPNKEYRAMPITFTSNEQEASFPDYAILDSATFLQNPGLPGIVITAPEVNFLKAEAFERWGGDAKTAYETAVKQSVTFYYYLNSLNTTGLTVLPAPASTVVNDFVTSSTIAYTGSSTEKLAKVWTEKWVHLGFLQSIEAWSEYRRTNYPQLTFPAAGLSGYQTPPTRLIYPTSEKTRNSTNYQAVSGKDTRNTKIFWDVN
ncbi:SusD/RagB family nutrient-binding outer membrane lipoprotein [Mucilaginibacter sp. Bleaf8]|uniref:SusD/RagB family nutrient-binding outer membrane lipoprotein n=1 Tax=Mucilaginibacter sp. Bleaf8 TaxID=2834430 RepID=UPI001BCAFCB6|nr:SusD/RagB family nutrient-binding outer membrane lipoprotein [Mucilaginibacter sp. Bleaf8]MBS7564861.1 SusD/RagB family nutrient-binding outer membrane lipoprotein [Mucilaginibacter sp. Bleaf8]